jgi:hypothetical protein
MRKSTSLTMIVALIYESPQQYDSAVYGSGESRDVVVNRQRSGESPESGRIVKIRI